MAHAVGKGLQKFDALVDAGPKTEKPDHREFEKSLLNQFIMNMFRNSLAQAAGGKDSELEGYA
mgnify:CR=1 FL=1